MEGWEEEEGVEGEAEEEEGMGEVWWRKGVSGMDGNEQGTGSKRVSASARRSRARRLIDSQPPSSL